MRNLMVLIIIVAVAGSAGAATYYVDSVNGLDDPARSGGPLEPWQTITYALSRVSGENTFMCKGLFEEEITVLDDDGGSTFKANVEAGLEGFFATKECLSPVLVRGFQIDGTAAAYTRSYLSVVECRLSHSDGWALLSLGQMPSLSVRDCVIANAKWAVVDQSEGGAINFYDTEIADCGDGVTIYSKVTWGVSGCRLERVASTALAITDAGGSARNSEFYDNGKGLEVTYGGSAAYGDVSDCVFRGNASAVKVKIWPGLYGRFKVERNDVSGNLGNGLDLSGDAVSARGNVVVDNGGHGVYIGENAPDLGTPKDPGGNTFAGNKSGYDVYNASSEDIPAYGNTWDPESEKEMAGGTWQTVNVTRIYDHWDDPSVGYVMWSEPMLGVAPASLGRIKASFQEGSASGLGAPGSAAAER